MNEKKVTDLLYKNFVGNNKDWKPEISGINYLDGYMRATDGYVLAKVHFEEYDFDFEDRTISRDGSEVLGNYPALDNLLPLTLEGCDTLPGELFRVIKAAPVSTRKQGEFCAVLVEGFPFHTFQLKAIYELFESIGEFPALKVSAQQKQKILAFNSKNCSAICISEIRPFTPKDILFTIDEALEFNPAK